MSNSTTTSHDQRFLTRLESIRGIAAICVAMTHSFVLFPGSELYPVQTGWQSAVHIFFPGTSALIVFFVISGYVLSLSLDRSEHTFRNILIFYQRRLLRIFPAHIVWVLIALVLLLTLHNPVHIPAASIWFNDMYSTEMSVIEVILNLALILTSLIPGEWTLTLELVVYLIYPILYLLHRKRGKIVNTLLLLFLLGLSFIGQEVRLFYYLYAFYIGLAAPSLYKSLIDRFPGRFSTFLLWMSLALLVTLPVFSGLFKFMTTAGQVLAGGFIVFACIFMKKDSVVFRILDRPLIERLGQISYSFYIIHFLMNYWIAYFLFGLLGSDLAGEFRFLFMLGVALVSIPITYQLARLSYERVEAPTMEYSRRLSKRLSGQANKAKPQ
jgi:peptidoglycan/LPS O-acetylase OafA/YrhL